MRSIFRSSITAGDPKFWPASLRYAIIANLALFAFMGNMYLTGITTEFAQLAEEFEVPFTKLTDQVAYCVLSLGFGSLIWMPCALCIGKRPGVIASMVIFFAGSVWSCKATSFNSLLGSRILATIGAGSIETLGPSIVGDLFFEKYFSTAIGAFSMSYTGGTQIGPLITGYLVEARGWRWFFYLCAILNGANLVLTLFLLPETSFRRQTFEGETAAEVDEDAKGQSAHVASVDYTENVEASSRDMNREYVGNYFKDLIQFRDRGMEERGMSQCFRRFIEPFQFLVVPQVLFAAFSFGLILSGILVISTMAPILLTPPPYSFQSTGIGLYALCSLIGVIVIYPLAGPLTDMISRVMRRRNGGIHLPEHRMPALVFPFLLAPPGLILFGYILAEGRSFYVSGVGYALQSAGAILIPSVVLSYVVDAYPRRGGEALVLVIAIKQAVMFGFTKAIPAWYENEGLKKMFVQMAAIQWAFFFLALPLYFASPWLRVKTLRFL